MMHITHLVCDLERGGMERVIVDLAIEQRKQGLMNDVVCLFSPGALADELISTGIPVTALNKRPGLDWRLILKLRKVMARVGTTVLHSHNAMPGYYGALASTGMGFQRVVNTRHGEGAGLSWRTEALFRLAILQTDAVAVVSKQAARRYMSRRILPPKKTTVIANGIKLELYVPGSLADKQDLLEELGLKGKRLLLGTVGRLHPLKDHRTLLQAFSLLLAKHPECALIIVGDGQEYESISSLRSMLGLEKNVIMLGDRSDVPRLLRGIDIFVLSSISEGYSLALVEAAASGLPTVATDVGGNAEIVQQNMTGLLVPKSEPQRLAQALAELCADPARRMALGKAARRWAEQSASVSAKARAYQKLYEGGA